MTDPREELPEQDERAWQDEVHLERREVTLEALYQANMRGLDQTSLRALCAECGVTVAEVDQYVPIILRPIRRQPTLDLQF